MITHAVKTTALSQIHSILQSLPPSAIKMLVVSLVPSRLDYGNTTLTVIPGYLLHRLQSVLNAAANVISGLLRLAHISTTLANLLGFVPTNASSLN